MAPIINLQVASGLMPMAGFILGVIGWGIAACTEDEHFIMYMTCIMIPGYFSNKMHDQI